MGERREPYCLACNTSAALMTVLGSIAGQDVQSKSSYDVCLVPPCRRNMRRQPSNLGC